MSESSRVLRGTVRAAVGLVVVALVATALFVLQGFAIPAVERTPPAIAVDTTQNSTQSLLCAGAFSVLGADPSRPEAAIPTGSPTVVTSGTPTSVEALTRTEGGDGPPVAIAAPAGEVIGAAQVQEVSTETAAGAAASACAAPVNEQWLLGGDTSEGVTTTLSLGNAGSVPATVQLTVFDENGQVSDAETAAVLVQPRSEQIVSVNGYAPGRASIAVHLVSTGAPVTASLGVSRVVGLDPFGVSTVTRQIEASTQLVIPGVTNLDLGHGHGPNDVGEESALGVHVRLLNPAGEGDDTAAARIIGLTDKGDRIDLGSMKIVGNAIADFAVPKWPAEVNAVLIESEVPVIGGAIGYISGDKHHDFDWFAPTPTLDAGVTVAAPVVDDGKLIIANPGETEAVVDLIPATGKKRTIKVKPASAVAVDATDTGTLSSSAPVYAGVRYTKGGDLAGYPINAPAEREGALTVYTR